MTASPRPPTTAGSVVMCCARDDAESLAETVAALRDDGHDVELLEDLGEDPKELGEVIERRGGDGLYVLCRSPRLSREQIEQLREVLLAHHVPFGRTLTVAVGGRGALADRIRSSLRRAGGQRESSRDAETSASSSPEPSARRPRASTPAPRGEAAVETVSRHIPAIPTDATSPSSAVPARSTPRDRAPSSPPAGRSTLPPPPAPPSKSPPSPPAPASPRSSSSAQEDLSSEPDTIPRRRTQSRMAPREPALGPSAVDPSAFDDHQVTNNVEPSPSPSPASSASMSAAALSMSDLEFSGSDASTSAAALSLSDLEITPAGASTSAAALSRSDLEITPAGASTSAAALSRSDLETTNASATPGEATASRSALETTNASATPGEAAASPSTLETTNASATPGEAAAAPTDLESADPSSALKSADRTTVGIPAPVVTGNTAIGPAPTRPEPPSPPFHATPASSSLPPLRMTPAGRPRPPSERLDPEPTTEPLLARPAAMRASPPEPVPPTPLAAERPASSPAPPVDVDEGSLGWPPRGRLPLVLGAAATVIAVVGIAVAAWPDDDDDDAGDDDRIAARETKDDRTGPPAPLARNDQPSPNAEPPAPSPAPIEYPVLTALESRQVRALDILLIANATSQPGGFSDAASYCERLDIEGLRGWRLPRVGELGSLSTANMIGRRGYFWSSTAADTFGDDHLAWNVRRGHARSYQKDAVAVCVRGEANGS